jgi:hypothetical protein
MIYLQGIADSATGDFQVSQHHQLRFSKASELIYVDVVGLRVGWRPRSILL